MNNFEQKNIETKYWIFSCAAGNLFKMCVQ